MAVAIALWSIVLKPNQEEAVFPQSDLRITTAALGHELADASARNSIKITYTTPVKIDSDDEEDEENVPEPTSTTFLCSLTAGKLEQTTLDIILEQDEEYIFENVGKNTVYLTGNYIDQTPPDNVPFDDEDEEDDFDLRDVSSDVEVDPLELGGMELDEDRFEEIHGEPDSKSLKRPRESDASEKAALPEGKLSKAEKKKLKKLKAEGGQAITLDTDANTSQAPKANDGQKKKDAMTSGGEKKKDATANSGEKQKKEPTTDGEKKGPAKDAGTTKELPGGLKYTDVKKGTGPQAKTGQTVSMRYIGKLQSGKIFDQNTTGKPFMFRLGEGEVIKGWDVGIAGMQVGGERVLTIPPAMAYGKRNQKDIPANSTLVFECKLLQIK